MKNSKIFATTLVAVLMFAVACTKHKDLQNKVDSKPYVDKTWFQGKTFHLVRGIEEADSDNNVEAIPGFSRDFGLVTVEITENELRLLTAFDPSGRKETAKVIASYPITGQFDIKRDQNDFGEDTNKIVEDTTAPWSQRRYMRVDWTKPSNALSKFTSQVNADGLEEVNTVLKEDMKNDNGHLSFVVETGIQGQNLMRPLPPFGEDPVSAFRVTYRTHLMPVKDSDFVPVPYSLADFSRFGFFATQQDFEDPQKGFRDADLKIYANVFNVCEAGHAGSCSSNQIKWVLSKDFPDSYKGVARRAVAQWNKTFQEDLNRKDDVVVLDESHQVDISDPRYNIIAYYPARASGGLLGVAQWVSDPRTGEIKSARATIYGDGINYELGGVDTYIDLMESNDPLTDVIGAEKYGSKSGLLMPYQNEVAVAAQQQKAQARAKGARASVRTNQLSRFMGIAGAARGTSMVPRSQIPFLSGNSTSKSRLSTVLTQAPDLLNSAETEKANMLRTDASSDKKDAASPLIRMMKVSEKIKSEKRARLLQSSMNIHGSEFVEEAVIRYLRKEQADLGGVQALKSQRETIKAKIAQEIFYTTLLHEMGHTFGLRHNFAGSADQAHFYPEWKAIKAKLQAGDKSVTHEDLAPYAYSSIMDYGADFFSQQGGLGPYDKAAIKYVYNRSVNRDQVEDAQHPYMFCTDHQLNETISCRQFDRGATASEITQNAIDSFHARWALTHYRRGRPEFDHFLDSVPESELISTMIPVRQVMDEFTYAMLMTDVQAAPPGKCRLKWWQDSIDAGEIANVCDPAVESQLSLDLNDVSTLIRALYDPKTKEFYKKDLDADSLQPFKLADFVRANLEAQTFFSEVLGSVEPGTYYAQPNPFNKQVYMLVKVPAGATQDERLQNLAAEVGVPDSQLPTFMKNAPASLVDMPVGRYAKTTDTATEQVGTFYRLKSIGAYWDKAAAMRALTIQDIGVSKYAAISMYGNPYFYFPSTSFMTGLFDRMIARTGAIATIPVQLNGHTVLALSTEDFTPDLQRMAGVFAVTELVADTDDSMLAKLRICVTGEAGCDNSLGGDIAEATNSAGNMRYRAAQTINSDSIAYHLVENLKDSADPRDKIVKGMNNPDQALKDDLASVDGTSDLRQTITKEIGVNPTLAKYQPLFSDTVTDHGFGLVRATIANTSKLDRATLLSGVNKGLQEIIDFRDALKAGSLAVSDDKQKQSLTDDVTNLIGKLGDAAGNELNLKDPSDRLEQSRNDLQQQEANIDTLRELISLTNRH